MSTVATGTRLSQAFAIALVFTLVAPIVGVVIFVIAHAYIGLGWNWDHSVLAGQLAVLFALAACYVIAGPPAFIGGLFIGLWKAFLGPVRLWLAALTGAVTGPAWVLLHGAVFLQKTTLPGWPAMFILIGSSAVAAIACWSIVRTWYDAPANRGNA